jgi:hypothetical protein
LPAAPEIDGFWERRSDGQFRCRWLACGKFHNEKFAGTVCGYSGHGCFEIENFVAVIVDQKLVNLYIDFRDLVQKTEIDFKNTCHEYLDTCNATSDILWEWNSWNDWERDDLLLLKKNKYPQTILTGDTRRVRSGTIPYLSEICRHIGLTASPAIHAH